jgi:hypothetical protein
MAEADWLRGMSPSLKLFQMSLKSRKARRLQAYGKRVMPLTRQMKLSRLIEQVAIRSRET